MPLKVLFLVTDLEIGGTPRVVRDLAIRLRSPEISTTVACLAPWGPVAGELLAEGVRVIELGATSSLQLPRVVRDLVRHGKSFDVIFSFLMHANVVASIAARWLGGVRFIQSIQTTQPDPRWHWLLQGFAERAADRIVVPSVSVANVAQRWSRIAPYRIDVIPNAIDVERFVALDLKPFTAPTTRVGFIGRLDPVKRVPDLVHAIAKTSNAELHVFGDGDERPHIEQTISSLGLESRVTLHGVIPSASEALRRIDVLVLPSDAEGFGLVLIEAMAAGIPVIATDVAGIRDVVQHERTGLLVRARSPDAIAGAIERVRSDPALRASLITQARDHVRQRYTWDSVLAQYRTLLLGNPRRSSPAGGGQVRASQSIGAS